MTVNLVIKSATQTVDDFNLDCELSWTISTVKDKISEVYPTKPKKENQKLIYGGKLLPDHLSLKSVLNHAQERHIMHLVCPSPVKTNQTESKETTSSESFPVPPSNPAFPPMNQPVLNPPSLSGMPVVNVAPFNQGDAFQQYLAMQQMYAQFMTQYLSQYNGGVPPVTPYGPVMPVPPVQTPQVPAAQQNAPANPPQRPADDEGHDYLDVLYIFSRTVMLFAVLYYYSSLSRVLIVVLMFLFISLYVKVSRQHQEMQRQANERQRSETVATQPVPADIQASGSEENTSSTSTSDDTSLSQQTEGRSFASMVSVTVSLISAFFSSLIPSEPVPVNVN